MGIDYDIISEMLFDDLRMDQPAKLTKAIAMIQSKIARLSNTLHSMLLKRARRDLVREGAWRLLVLHADDLTEQTHWGVEGLFWLNAFAACGAEPRELAEFDNWNHHTEGRLDITCPKCKKLLSLARGGDKQATRRHGKKNQNPNPNPKKHPKR